MSCCPHCVDSEDFFSERTARRDLKRFRKKGPRASSQALIEALQPFAPGRTLLDIGGGVGILQHALFDAGLAGATQVDASHGYLAMSREEAERRGNGDRTHHRFGDFVDVAHEIPPADIVTLDRVVCCYPDYRSLLSEAADHARHVIGLVYPRDRRLVRLVLWFGNAFFRLRGSAFRTFVHPPERLDDEILDMGFREITEARTMIWQVKVFQRIDPSEVP